MKNKIQDGRTINYINESATAIASGDVVPFDDCISIAVADIAASGGMGAVEMTGVYELAADNTQAFAVGNKLYWDTTNKKLTTTATDNIPAGMCTEVKGTTDTTGFVRIG